MSAALSRPAPHAATASTTWASPKRESCPHNPISASARRSNSSLDIGSANPRRRGPATPDLAQQRVADRKPDRFRVGVPAWSPGRPRTKASTPSGCGTAGTRRGIGRASDRRHAAAPGPERRPNGGD